MSIKKYALIYGLSIIVITGLLASINYFIDPYLLYGSNRISGINDKKPATANRSALFKPYQAIAVKPTTLVVGNSRPEMGINPESSCWPNHYGTIYSLTFPGMSFYGQIRALFHAVSDSPVENILLGVDFVDFLQLREQPKKNYWPPRNSDFFDRLRVDEKSNSNSSYRYNQLKDFSAGLFSLTALNDSVSTLLSQNVNSVNRTHLGFNPARDYLDIIRHEGPRVLYRQKMNELNKRFEQPGMSVYDAKLWSTEFEGLKRTIQLALAQNIQLTIYINPYHYSYFEAIEKSGYWPEFEAFKKGLMQVVKQYGQNKVALWDFALYSNYTVSPKPSKKEAKKFLRWFWEPAHYKAKLGEYLLSDMYQQSCVKKKLSPVGVKLNDIDIDRHLAKQRQLSAFMTLQIEQ